MTKSRYKVNSNILKLGFIILLSSRFSYVLPEYIGKQAVSCENLTVLFAVLFTYEVMYRFRARKVKYEYWWLMLIVLMLVLSSSYQASERYYGQSILDGISCQKYMLTGIMLYFPITALIKCKKISIAQLQAMLLFCAWFQIIVYSIQYVLGPNHIFLSCYYTTPAIDSRVIRIRLYGFIYPILISLIFVVNRIVNNKRWKGDILYTLASLFFAIVVNQGRQYIVLTVVIMLSGLILARTSGPKKIPIIIFVIMVVSTLYSSSFVQDLVSQVTTATAETHSSIGTRLRAQEFYKEIIGKNLLLGGGYADNSIASAAAGSGYSLDYFVADNGIVAFIFCYGFLGLFLFIPLLLIFIKNGMRMQKNGDCVVLMELCSILVGIANDASWFTGFGLLFTFIFLIYIEAYYVK